MSASRTPTVSPCAAMRRRRGSSVTVDLPTPPLPEATAYTRVREPGCGERDLPLGPVAADAWSVSALRCSSFITSEDDLDTDCTPASA